MIVIAIVVVVPEIWQQLLRFRWLAAAAWSGSGSAEVAGVADVGNSVGGRVVVVVVDVVVVVVVVVVVYVVVVVVVHFPVAHFQLVQYYASLLRLLNSCFFQFRFL